MGVGLQERVGDMSGGREVGGKEELQDGRSGSEELRGVKERGRGVRGRERSETETVRGVEQKREEQR